MNIPLLRKMVEWVEEQELLTEGREWSQRFWFSDRSWDQGFCDTAFCMAGKLVIDDGWLPSDDHGPTIHKDGQDAYIGAVAANLLELEFSDAWGLFSPSNTAADIRLIAEEIAGEPL